MRIVIINMRDYIFADAIAQALQADSDSDFTVQKVTSVDEIEQYSKLCDPYAILMEVTGYLPYTLEERLKVVGAVKTANANCKVILMVDENSEPDIAEQVRKAKKDGQIDQFIYGSVSANYLVALMDTL